MTSRPLPELRQSSGGIAAALAVAFVIAGCSAPAALHSDGSSPTQAAAPSTTASTNASATATPPATAGQSQAFEAPAGVLPPASRAVVLVDALHVREEPGLSAPVVATVAAGAVVSVFGWHKAEADGSAWYEVGFQAQHGWAATGAGGEQYLEIVPPRCPGAAPDLAGLTSLTAWERLACFGDRPQTVTGTYGCGGCGGTAAGTYEPTWLVAGVNVDFLWVKWRAGGALPLHLAPDSGLAFPPEGSIVRTTGHFNDPASTTCVISGTLFVVDPEAAVLFCREAFVVDAFEVTGTDTNFTPGG